MKIIIGKDMKSDIGYQVALIQGPIMKVYRGTPDFMDLATTCRIAGQLLEDHNRKFGTHYQPEECIGIDEEAFEANAGRDVNAARAWQEIQSGHFREVSYSPMGADEIFKSQYSVKRGPKEKNGTQKISIKISSEGIFLALVKGTLFDNDAPDDPQISGIIDAFCRILATRGYGKGAKEIRRDMVKMGEDHCTVWVHDMIQRYHFSEDDFNRMAYEAGFR